jgi:hypothetical protein
LGIGISEWTCTVIGSRQYDGSGVIISR